MTLTEASRELSTKIGGGASAAIAMSEQRAQTKAKKRFRGFDSFTKAFKFVTA